MDEKLISVITPTYNRADLLKETIKSVLNQTYQNFEYIIIDNESTDNTKEVVLSFKDERIKYFRQKNMGGPASARNVGIKIAKGDYIAFVDSDDIWDEKKLEKQLKILDKDENLIIWTDGDIIDIKSNPIGKKFTQMEGATRKKKSGNIFKELSIGNFILLSSIILKKRNLRELRFNERLRVLEDYLFVINLARDYEFYFINETLVKYRIHDTNINTQNIKLTKNTEIIIKTYILKKYGNLLPKHIKWRIILFIITVLFREGKMKNARSYIYEGIKIYPFKILNYWHLLWSFVGSNLILRIKKFLKKM